MTILVIAEHESGTLRGATLSTVTAAAKVGEDVHVLVLGDGVDAAADAASRLGGVSKVLVVDSPVFTNELPETVAAQILAVAGSYSHIFFASTASGKNVAPRVAAKLNSSQVSDVIAVVSRDTFKRPIYAGYAIATVQSADPVIVATIRTTSFEAATSSAATSRIESRPAVAGSGLSKFVERNVSKSGRPELTSAAAVVSGGRGLGSAANFSLLDPLAEKLGAAVGASRAAVDSGFAPNDLQVGQTGKIVAPELYIAVGISGAIQHLAGMKDSKVIVAINKDADAPIFGIADYGLVGDLFELVPELTRAI
ncbi:electron transfer flavoprotein subunit alpha/FixB family protein [Trinickia mobilis]|uniref:electron transfer flavoprotein subunit alpha/FixB family protein n=1 Tax=Trinickia mobilis TaxID=2816356 RepID=UPI001A8D2743|nr:FAD-binding protein [Trinickia mobilis]